MREKRELVCICYEMMALTVLRDEHVLGYLVASPSRKVLMRYVNNLLIVMQNATY